MLSGKLAACTYTNLDAQMYQTIPSSKITEATFLSSLSYLIMSLRHQWTPTHAGASGSQERTGGATSQSAVKAEKNEEAYGEVNRTLAGVAAGALTDGFDRMKLTDSHVETLLDDWNDILQEDASRFHQNLAKGTLNFKSYKSHPTASIHVVMKTAVLMDKTFAFEAVVGQMPMSYRNDRASPAFLMAYAAETLDWRLAFTLSSWLGSSPALTTAMIYSGGLEKLKLSDEEWSALNTKEQTMIISKWMKHVALGWLVAAEKLRSRRTELPASSRGASRGAHDNR